MELILALKLAAKIVIIIPCAFLAGYSIGNVLKVITGWIDTWFDNIVR